MKLLSQVMNEINEGTTNPIDDKYIFVDDPEIIAALNDYNRGKEIEKSGKEICNRAKNILEEKLLINNITSVRTNTLTLDISVKNRMVFDTEKFKLDNPSLYDAYKKSSEYKTFTIKAIEITNTKKSKKG